MSNNGYRYEPSEWAKKTSQEVIEKSVPVLIFWGVIGLGCAYMGAWALVGFGWASIGLAVACAGLVAWTWHGMKRMAKAKVDELFEGEEVDGR